MKILVLCYEYPPIGGGGGRVAQSVAQQLATQGHELRVQTAGMPHLPRRETVRGVEVYRTPSFRKREDTCAVHEMGLFLATSFLPALRHIRQWQPDVMHAHFAMPTGVLAWALHRLTGVPYVLTAHLGDVPGGVPDQTDTLFKILGPVARSVWNGAAAATAVSSFVKDLAERAYDLPVTRILNGVNLTETPRVPPTQVGDPPHLVFLGRLNPQKNAPLLIDALSQVAGRPWKLTLIGDGPDLPAVRERLARHGLESRVTLKGWLRADAVQEILAGGDVLCMPSSSEGMPVAAVEALKNGLAIAASDIPGVRDVVQDGINGWVTPVNDARAYADRLRAALERPDRISAMKSASWEKARQFELGVIGAEYAEVLSRATETIRR